MGSITYLTARGKIGWEMIVSILRFLSVFLTIVMLAIILQTIKITRNNMKKASICSNIVFIAVKIAPIIMIFDIFIKNVVMLPWQGEI